MTFLLTLRVNLFKIYESQNRAYQKMLKNFKKQQLGFFVSLLTLFFNCSYLKAQNISLSFDDGLNPQLNIDAKQINQDILKHLKDADIKTIVFPSLIKIGDVQGKQLIRTWGEQGHLIGNHSASHQNLNKDNVSVESYLQSIRDAETVFKDLPLWTQRYRYPFLKEGNTTQKVNAVKLWLHQNNYENGAVSIDASDWFYNQKYLFYVKLNQAEKLVHLKKAYIAHLLDRATYYDDLAQNILGRSPDHVLLLHINAINAAYLPDIIQAFQKQKWTFITTQQAFKDPLYQMHTQHIPAGESIIWSLAKQKGIDNLRYPAEDSLYEIDNLKRHLLD